MGGVELGSAFKAYASPINSPFNNRGTENYTITEPTRPQFQRRIRLYHTNKTRPLRPRLRLRNLENLNISEVKVSSKSMSKNLH